MKNKSKIAILGAGSFPVGLAYAFKAFEKIEMWEHNPAHARLMQKDRKSMHLHGVTIPDNVYISSSIARVIQNAVVIIFAVPSWAVEDTAKKAKKHIKNGQTIIICSKGFASRQRLLSDAVYEICPLNKILCLSGPNLAREMVEGKTTAATLAGDGGESIKKLLESSHFIIELSQDDIGVQIGGALKNVITMLLGIAEGVGLGQNATSYLFVKGIQEVERIGTSFGGFNETFYDLSCLGDLRLRSRNREIGLRIGQGEKLAAILKTIDYSPEGIATAKSAYVFARHHDLDVPVINCLYAIVKKKQDPETALLQLFKVLREQG